MLIPGTDQVSKGSFLRDCPIWCNYKMNYFGCSGCICCSSRKKHSSYEDDEDVDSSGESESEFLTPFTQLSTAEKTRRIIFLWGKAISRARGAMMILHKLQDLETKLIVYGATQKNEVKRETEAQDDTKAKCVILPDNKHKIRWNVWISILLLYTGIVVPIKVAFFDKPSLSGILLDCMIYLCFITDVVLTFFTAYERRDGSLEKRHKYITREYFKAWFWVDTISSIPV